MQVKHIAKNTARVFDVATAARLRNDDGGAGAEHIADSAEQHNQRPGDSHRS